MKGINLLSSYMTRFGRRDDGFFDIALEAFRSLLDGADIGRVGHVYVASYAPTELCGIEEPLQVLAQAIDSEFGAQQWKYHGLYKTGGHALHDALEDLIVSGDDRDAIVVGIEKMTHLSPAVVAGRLTQRESQLNHRYGATLPALGALITRAYMRKHGIPERALHGVAAKNHRHAADNPKAHFQRVVPPEEIAESVLIADPLRRFHCAPISDGAAAVLLSRRRCDVAVVGWGKGVDSATFQDRGDITRFVATERAARAALGRCRMTAGDVDVVEIHDAFSSFELINLEAMGFYERGEAWKALESGELTIGARLPVNPSGGMKARGHPIAATALSGAVEIHEQLTRRAGGRQQPGVRVGMIQSVGGVSADSFTFVLDAG